MIPGTETNRHMLACGNKHEHMMDNEFLILDSAASKRFPYTEINLV